MVPDVLHGGGDGHRGQVGAAIERIASDGSRAAKVVQVIDQIAVVIDVMGIIEGVGRVMVKVNRAPGCQVGDVDPRQAGAVAECIVPDGSHRAIEGHLRHARTVVKRIRTDGGHSLAKGVARHLVAEARPEIIIRITIIRSGIRIVGRGHSVAVDGHRGQGRAAIEGMVPDGLYGTGDGHRVQASTTFECILADGRQAVAEGHSFNTRAACESIVLDGSHIAGDTQCRDFV